MWVFLPSHNLSKLFNTTQCQVLCEFSKPFLNSFASPVKVIQRSSNMSCFSTFPSVLSATGRRNCSQGPLVHSKTVGIIFAFDIDPYLWVKNSAAWRPLVKTDLISYAEHGARSLEHHFRLKRKKPWVPSCNNNKLLQKHVSTIWNLACAWLTGRWTCPFQARVRVCF